MSALNPFEAQAKLAKLPVSPEAIDYLMALANGANSEIPRFMALGRLEQMKQELASNKPSQPPQGTVKDKIEQAVGIMALRGGQQQQAAQQMAQAAPQGIPQGIPQPQMQPQSEEEQMPEMDVQTGADGGLMRARVDPRMFDFAPGGIVSFSGETSSRVELGKEKPLTKEEREKLENELRMRKIGAEYRQAVDARAQALAEERAAAAAQEPSPVPTTVAQEPSPAPTGARAMTGKIGESAVPAQALAPTPAPAAPRDGLDDESQFRKDLRGLAGVFTRTEEQKAKKKELDRLNLAGAPINYFLQSASDFAKNRAAREAANSGAGIASLQKEKPQLQGPRVLTGDAAAEQDRLAKAREAFNAPPVAAAPAAAPRPAAAPAAPRPPVAPAAPAPGLSQGVGELAKTLTPQVDATKVRTAYAEADPTVRSIEQIAEDQKKIYDLTGVGTYGAERRKQIANMRHEFEQSRPSTSEDVIDMIRAGIRPGAIAGAAGEYSSQLKREREARLSFSKAEDALNDAVERADEAIRSGKASEIVKTRDEERKAKADYKKAKVAVEQAVMTAESSAAEKGLMAATQVTTTGMSNLTSLQVAKIQAAATRAGLTKPSESERIGAEYRRILGAGGQKAADAFLADEAKIRAAVSGVKYEGQPEKKAAIELKVQEEVRKRVPNIDLKLQNPNLKPADRAKYEAARELVEKDVRRKLRNATGDEEGGGGGQFLVTAPNGGGTFQFNSQAEADAYKQRIGG